MYNPDRSFGFLLYDAARLIRRDFERRVRDLGLTRAQWAALAHLRRDEGCNQSTLADYLEVEPITLARLLDRMERAGWIERRPDARDRRARLIFLTSKARPVIDTISDLAVQSTEVALEGIPEDERERTIDLLLKVRSNLAAAGAGRAAGAQPRRPVGENGHRNGNGGDSRNAGNRNRMLSGAGEAVRSLSEVAAAVRK